MARNYRSEMIARRVERDAQKRIFSNKKKKEVADLMQGVGYLICIVVLMFVASTHGIWPFMFVLFTYSLQIITASMVKWNFSKESVAKLSKDEKNIYNIIGWISNISHILIAFVTSFWFALGVFIAVIILDTALTAQNLPVLKQDNGDNSDNNDVPEKPKNSDNLGYAKYAFEIIRDEDELAEAKSIKDIFDEIDAEVTARVDGKKKPYRDYSAADVTPYDSDEY